MLISSRPLACGLQTVHRKRPHGFEGFIDSGLFPIRRMRRMMKTDRGIEQGRSSIMRVGALKCALADTVVEDSREVGPHPIIVALKGQSVFRRERGVSREEIGIFPRFAPQNHQQNVKPATQPFRCGPGLGGDDGERSRKTREPALKDSLKQSILVREMPVDAAMADPQRAGNINDCRFERAEAAQYVLRRVENTLGGQGAFIQERFTRRHGGSVGKGHQAYTAAMGLTERTGSM